MAETIHVFICYSSLSFDAALRIAHFTKNQYGEDSSGKENTGPLFFFFVLFSADRSQLPDGAQVFEMHPAPQYYSEWTRPFAIARWFSGALKELNTFAPNEIHAYLPHPFELPGNHFLFHDARVTRRELLPDGLINYFHRTLQPESPGKALRYVTRIALRLSAAVRYRLLYTPFSKGHITQYERGLYDRSWTLNEEGYLTRGRELAQLPPRPGNQRVGASNSKRQVALLILDQEIHQIVSSSLEDRLRSALLQEALLLQKATVYYKAHPRGKNRVEELRQGGLKVQDETGSGLAEALIEQEGITHLLGFYSTPLVLSRNEVESRISIFPVQGTPGILRPHLVGDIYTALRASGARLISP